MDDATSDAPAQAGPAPAGAPAPTPAPGGSPDQLAPEEAARECVWCHRAPGLFLLGLAGALAYFGLDLYFNGAISAWLSGGRVTVQEGGGDAGTRRP